MAKKKPTSPTHTKFDGTDDYVVIPDEEGDLPISSNNELLTPAPIPPLGEGPGTPSSLDPTPLPPISGQDIIPDFGMVQQSLNPTPIPEAKMARTKRQERVKKALLQGCNNDAPRVVVNVENVLELLSLEVCEENNLFPWVVDTQETEIKKRKPSSVVPASSINKLAGRTEVDRAKLVELIESL